MNFVDEENLSDSGGNNDGGISFEDSDRFDEDMSLCSCGSDPESICGDWRGWKRSNNDFSLSRSNQPNAETLIEKCCKVVAMSVPFETVERMCPNLPEQLLLRIAFWSFPQTDDNIRLYSCLANGSSEEFSKGEQLYRAKAVVEALQIGFHLNGIVLPQNHGMVVANTNIEQLNSHKPAVLFDQGHVTSCMCTCSPSAAWCSHIVALCLHRIYQPSSVTLRPPLSESLSKLRHFQLRKFSQYLLSELPHELLPFAQKLLDDLLLFDDSKMNVSTGAPDPTAGPPADTRKQWWMDGKALRENIRKMLSKFCGPGPFMLEEAYSLQFASTAPPTAAEWSNLLRPLTSHEPEGMWNLLSIVRELFRHRDCNAVEVLELLTQECLAFEQIVVWWFNSSIQGWTRNQQSFRRDDTGNNYRNCINTASTEMTKNACASFCDEIVVLWRLACLNPIITSDERLKLKEKLEILHQKTIEKARNARYLGEQIFGFGRATENFPGFKIAIEACSLDWSMLALPSLTHRNPHAVHGTIGAQTDVLEKEEVENLDEDVHTLFTRAEALHVHGCPEARKLCEHLTERILSDACRKVDNAAEHGEETVEAENANCFINTTLARTSFLCNVFSSAPAKHHLAFKIGLHGLEAARKPARNKALEVKLANEESELVNLLTKLPLGLPEVAVVREKALSLCRSPLERGRATLPIKFAIFLFHVLSKQSSREDKELGFNAALAALNMKANVPEVECPMLREGMRRQRGELALALIDYSKDNQENLDLVKMCLLDKSRYGLDARYNHPRRNVKNRRRRSRSRDKTQTGASKRTDFAQLQQQVSSKLPSAKVRTSSKSSSSSSRQSSWSSMSDDLSPREEFRAARDSGRDSENDTLDLLLAPSSKENHSDGERRAYHSPNEEVVVTRRRIASRGGGEDDPSGPCDSNYEGTGPLPISVVRDSNTNPAEDEMSVAVAVNHAKDARAISSPLYDGGWMEDQCRSENKSLLWQSTKKDGSIENPSHGKRHSKWRNDKRVEREKNMFRRYQGNRSLEAEAHFMFELAKKVLKPPGGASPSSTSLFGQVDPAGHVSSGLSNRSMQLLAFELGLFALGLHNITCFNWLSRTYSAHVSWISTQALELGSVALTILLDSWKLHLTPSEVASIADRASKSNDQETVRIAAQLALACLSMAHTLNPGNIRMSLALCKEQGSDLLAQACTAVESAAQGGGVYPEVLFEVAKLWEYLYQQDYPVGENEEGRDATSRGENERQLSFEAEDAETDTREDELRESHEDRDSLIVRALHSGGRGALQDSYPNHLASHHAQLPSLMVKLSRLGLTSSHHMLPKSPYPYLNPNYGLFVPLPTPEQIVQQQVFDHIQHLIEPYQVARGQQVPFQLANTYRVGLLALENLGRRPTDDQANSMFAKNPPHKANVHWLCKVANRIGHSALQRFCVVCASSIHSPYLLHEIALEVAGLMAKTSPNQIAFHLRSPSLFPMVQKCLMNYSQCVQQSLQGLPKSEYPEFVELIMHARRAYCMAQGGMSQFNELLQNIRRNTVKKKDLWQRITAALAHQPK